MTEHQTDYICPQCREKVMQLKSEYFSKQNDPVYRYFCKCCGWTMMLHEKDAVDMRKKGVW